MPSDLPLSDDFLAFRRRTAWPLGALGVAGLAALASLFVWRTGWGMVLAGMYAGTAAFFVYRHRQAYGYLCRDTPPPACPACGGVLGRLHLSARTRDRFGVTTTYRLDCAACRRGLAHVVSASGNRDGSEVDLARLSRQAALLRAASVGNLKS